MLGRAIVGVAVGSANANTSVLVRGTADPASWTGEVLDISGFAEIAALGQTLIVLGSQTDPGSGCDDRLWFSFDGGTAWDDE